MSIQIAPELEAGLQSAAAREGLTPDEMAARVLAEWLEDRQDVEIAQFRLANPVAGEANRTLDDLRRHLGR
jgi:hypothetical protein